VLKLSEKVDMGVRDKYEEFFSTLQSLNPNPTTELCYRSHFQLLIAVILSAQATDVSVNKATRSLFKQAPNATRMFALGEAGLKEYIKTIGLYNSKAKNVIKTCRILIDLHCGKVPRSREALEALPGVGRKTANVVLNTAFGESTMAVDTHIFRVANRTGLAKGKTPLAVEKRLLQVIPEQYIKNAHHWLILHGRYICMARSPLCESCPVSGCCSYKYKNE
jgi:endonuclease III